MKKIRPHFDRNPSFRRADWLPEDSGWPELDALRERHLRMLDQIERTITASGDVRRRHEAEDEERKDALTAAYRDGTEVDKSIPAPTRPEQRQAEIAAATEQAEAALDALEEFIGEALAKSAAHRDDWFEQLADREAEGEQKRAEAQRLVAEADAAASELRRMRFWVDRQTGGRLGPIAFGALDTPPTDTLPGVSPSVLDDVLARAREIEAGSGIEVIA